MKTTAADALRSRLKADGDADCVTLETTTDKTMAIGQDVWRLRWRGQLTTAVASDAGLHTTCGALLDAFAMLKALSKPERDTRPAVDLTAVNVLVDRPLPGDFASETDQALRSMRDATQGVHARIWYQGPSGDWAEDCEPAPTWPEDDPDVAGWREHYLLPRLTAKPSPLARALVGAVDDPSLHLYPSAINARASDVWALRLDGLQIGTASSTSAELMIGKPGKGGDGPQRRAFTEVFGRPSVTVSAADEPPSGQLSVGEGADGIRRLLRRFREVDVRGAPISHRVKGGFRVIDEHTLEARLLKGLTHLDDTDEQLVLDDVEVARGSQFPTLWGHGGGARFLDALLRRGATPLAVELKVATGGQGRYYRRSLVQAVLYRHFIRNAPGLENWFKKAGLDRMATEACIGVPIPVRWTPKFSCDLERLKGIAEMLGAQVHVLDDRVTPDWVATEGLPEPELHETELLSWRMAAALSSRWPKSLGRIVERHECGGFYDQIQLQDLADRTLALPSPRPRISLNRSGSLCVFSQTGSVRWRWREIWNLLAHGGDAREAAVIVGAIAGLGRKEIASGPCFAELALAFLEAVEEPGWSWRCAWPDSGEVSPWVERYRAPLARYKRMSADGALPAIARIWGVVRDGEAAVIVDQQNLRTWVWVDGDVRQLSAEHPLERIATAVELVVADF